MRAAAAAEVAAEEAVVVVATDPSSRKRRSPRRSHRRSMSAAAAAVAAEAAGVVGEERHTQRRLQYTCGQCRLKVIEFQHETPQQDLRIKPASQPNTCTQVSSPPVFGA